MMSMMTIAVGVISIALLVTCRVLYSSYCNPVSFYVIPWSSATILAMSGLFGIYRPKDSTVALIVFAMISFSAGCVLIHALQKSRARNGAMSLLGQDCYRTRNEGGYLDFKLSVKAKYLLYIMGFVAVLFELYLASRSIPLLVSGRGLDYIKYQYSNVQGTTLYTTHELLLFSWVAEPIIICMMIFFGCELCARKVNWATLGFSVAGCALYIAISGGRNLLFIFACILLVTLILSSQFGGALNWIRTLPKVVKAIVIILVLAMVYITEQRSLGHDAGVLENTFFYLVGGITYFDQMLGGPEMFGLFNGDYLLGWCTFGFIINPVLIVASIVFRFDYVGSDSILSDAASVNLSFNDTLRGNGLCTSLYAFLRDFGMPGIVIGPLLFGIMVGLVWEKTFRWRLPDPKWFPVCVYLIYCVLFSDWRYILVFPGTTAVFLAIAITNVLNGRGKHETCVALGADCGRDLGCEKVV